MKMRGEVRKEEVVRGDVKMRGEDEEGTEEVVRGM